MKMRSIYVRTALALAAVLGSATAAQAQSNPCGITGMNATATPVLYDPFKPGGLPSTTLTLNLTRTNLAGGSKTDVANFYLKGRDTSADGTQIYFQSFATAGNVNVVGSQSSNIFYNYNAPKPTISPASVTSTSALPFLKMTFSGNNVATDNVSITFRILLPENLDLASSTSLAFDGEFWCSTSGGAGNKQELGGTVSNAMTFPITVLSALQATYAGTALDFGEVGDKTTANVLAAPATYTTSQNNHVSVRSSGPYKVQLTSQNGYKMTFPGGNLGTANQVLNYDLRFLGQTLNAAQTSFSPVTCLRAGVPAASADRLPVVATLKEGGQGKLVSPSYSDILTVTVTPLLAGAPSQQNCPVL